MIRRTSWLASLALAVVACNPADPNLRHLTVSASTRSAAPPAAAVAASALGGSLTFSSAQVTLRKIELATASTTCAAETEADDAIRMSADMNEPDDDGADDADHEAGCEELNVGPLTVSLPLDASTKLVLDALVPAGTYTGVRARLDAVTVAGTFTDAAGAAHPFSFTSQGGEEIEIKFPAPITVGPTTTNVTVTVDVASWFKDASGAVLDPADPLNAATINRNIRRSFHAFGDDDRDGVDDEHDDQLAR